MVAAVKKRAACTLLTLGQVLPLEEIIRCRFLREGGGIENRCCSRRYDGLCGLGRR
mgnify:CR=1 FL=1